MDWIIANWDSIFTVIGIIATIVAPVALPYIAVLNKGGKELVKLIDKSSQKNVVFKQLAEKEGLKIASKLIAKLRV